VKGKLEAATGTMKVLLEDGCGEGIAKFVGAPTVFQYEFCAVLGTKNS
jgi:hypothetical protein